jgi:hypothetical protein
MLSLLHQADYERLGDIEVRKSDWERIRAGGFLRFIASCVLASYSGRVGALILMPLLGYEGINRISSGGLWLIGLSFLALVGSISYGLHAWFRLKQRFGDPTRDVP